MAHKTLGIPSKADGTMGGVPVGGVAGPAEELERRTPFATQTREVGEVLGMHSVGPKRHPEEVAVPARGGAGGPTRRIPCGRPAEEGGHEELEEGPAHGHGTGDPTNFAAPVDELGGQVCVRRLARV